MAKKSKKDKKKKKDKKQKKAKVAVKEKAVKEKKVKKTADPTAVFTTLHQLTSLISRLEEEPLENEDVVVYQSEINALLKIKEKPDHNLTQLSEDLNISKSALLKATNKLIHKNLISKEKHPDTRQVTYSLTEDGEKIVEFEPQWRLRMEQPIINALEEMSNKELAYFNDALERITISLENVN